MVQYLTWAAGHVFFFALGVVMFGWLHGLKVYALAVGLPGVLRALDVDVLQLRSARAHRSVVGAQPFAQLHRHSASTSSCSTTACTPRTTSKPARTGARSEPPTRKSRAEIDPALRPRSFWWFCFSNYVLALVMPRFGTRQIGRAPFDCPTGEIGTLKTDEVDAVESGVNAVMA